MPMPKLADVPLDEIHTTALPRDRTITDPEAFEELKASIETDGLRQPIELFGIEPEGKLQYGLISGFRRIAALRELGRTTVPAFLCNFDDLPHMLRSMVSENEIRAQVSPWEKAMLVLTCLRANFFPNADAAIDALYPALSRQKRSRMRGHVMVVDEFEYILCTPERLSVSRLDRLAAALRAGWEDLLRNAIPDRRTHTLLSQWDALRPVLDEALSPSMTQPAPASPGAPRRMANLRRNLTVRRELTRTGWILRFTGSESKSPGIIDDVLDEIERIFSPR